MKNNSFYFSISASFQKDYDVSKLENILGVKAKKLTYLKDSISPIPSSKFLYNTKVFEGQYTDEIFKKFIDSLYNKAPNLREEIEKNNGKLSICIVFKNFVTKPCLYMSNDTLLKLSALGANFDVDII